MIDLTAITTQKEVDSVENWDKEIQYNGLTLFDKYMSFLEWLDDNTQELKYAKWTETKIDEDYDEDDEDGDSQEYEEEVTRELQESYMGYVPSTDTFITGFDMWEDDDNPAGIAYWKINEDGSFKLVSEDIDYFSDMMYGKNGALKKLRSKHADLIDIRLD